MERKKILVSAYGCEPGRGSEAGVGWNWVIQLAKEYDLDVITRANDREKIEQNIPEEIKDSLHFIYYDRKRLVKIKKREKRLYLYYFFWQTGIIKIIRRLKREVKFDYSMHLSFGSLWMPTFLPFFKIPFIWGPVGGADGAPKPLLNRMPFKNRMVQKFRYFLVKTSFLNPRVAIPSRKAVAILCRTKNNREAIPKKHRNKTHIIIETGMTNETDKYAKDYDVQNEKIEIAVVGRLIPIKNVEAAIDVFKSVKEEVPNVHMSLIGDGPLRKSLEEKTKEYGIEESIDFCGEIPREQVLQKLQKADIYFLPSLKEGGSWSLMEAMSIGLPTVCLDWTGMGDIVDEQSGIKVEVKDYDKTNQEFAKGIVKLANNSELRKQLGLNAKQRIRDEFSWESKLDFMKKLIGSN